MKETGALLDYAKCSKCNGSINSEFQHGGYVEYYMEDDKIYCKKCADKLSK